MKLEGISSAIGFDPGVKEPAHTVEGEGFKDLLAVAAESGDAKSLREACEAFESFFIEKLFKQMRAGTSTEGFIEKSNARATFEGMLDEQMSKEMSKAGGIGLADYMFDSLKRAYGLEEEPSKASSEDLLSKL